MENNETIIARFSRLIRKLQLPIMTFLMHQIDPNALNRCYISRMSGTKIVHGRRKKKYIMVKPNHSLLRPESKTNLNI